MNCVTALINSKNPKNYRLIQLEHDEYRLLAYKLDNSEDWYGSLLEFDTNLSYTDYKNYKRIYELGSLRKWKLDFENWPDELIIHQIYITDPEDEEVKDRINGYYIVHVAEDSIWFRVAAINVSHNISLQTPIFYELKATWPKYNEQMLYIDTPGENISVYSKLVFKQPRFDTPGPINHITYLSIKLIDIKDQSIKYTLELGNSNGINEWNNKMEKIIKMISGYYKNHISSSMYGCEDTLSGNCGIQIENITNLLNTNILKDEDNINSIDLKLPRNILSMITYSTAETRLTYFDFILNIEFEELSLLNGGHDFDEFFKYPIDDILSE